MKRIYLFFILLLVSTVIFAQQPPVKTTYFLFEDAVGNRDSVFIGFDSSQVEGSIIDDSAYGEVRNETPMDSVFDVRVGEFVFWIPELYDHYITDCLYKPQGPSNSRAWYAFPPMEFYIQCKYPPFTVCYDSTLYQEDLSFRGSAIVDRHTHFLTFFYDYAEHDPEAQLHCLANQRCIEFDWDVDTYRSGTVDIFDRMIEVEGQGLQQLFSLSYNPSTIQNRDFYGCEPEIMVSSRESEAASVRVAYAPNPTTGAITIESPFAGDVDIYTATGELVQTKPLQKGSNALALKVSSGLYYLRFYNEGKTEQQVGKLMVVP